MSQLAIIRLSVYNVDMAIERTDSCMDYMPASEAAKKWGILGHWVQKLCEKQNSGRYEVQPSVANIQGCKKAC